MPDFKNSTFQKRRATDCEQCAQIIKAFVVNDLGEPDFDGHRKAHAQMIEAEKVLHGLMSMRATWQLKSQISLMQLRIREHLKLMEWVAFVHLPLSMPFSNLGSPSAKFLLKRY